MCCVHLRLPPNAAPTIAAVLTEELQCRVEITGRGHLLPVTVRAPKPLSTLDLCKVQAVVAAVVAGRSMAVARQRVGGLSPITGPLSFHRLVRLAVEAGVRSVEQQGEPE